MNKTFRLASEIVDRSIRNSGESVSVEIRNQRVSAAMYKLRNGEPPESVDPLARIFSVGFLVPLPMVNDEAD